MAAEIRQIYPENPQPRLIKHAVEILESGGLIVYPTDTIYGLGVDLFNKQAMERVLRLKRTSQHKFLSFICPDLKDIARYAIVPDYGYKIMRRVAPGRYTFVLRANREIPKILIHHQKTIGVRIPDSKVAVSLCRELGRPILSASVPHGSDGYYTDPHEIAEKYKHEIDLVLDAGIMFNQPSTIVDFTGDEPVILREGSGDLAALSY
jgi:tRNA threonylcarbamoyl adenosine modification protein (Sua5/YciO/YrdC/YwlC family)